jgi:hypothetical protein
MLDLFTQNQQESYDFSWIVAVFAGLGASEVIKRANNVPLKTFYPFRIAYNGEPIPLWRNYLFVEFRERVTIDVCRSTSKFLKVLSIHDKEGILHPVLVRKDAIRENLELLQRGKFNDKVYLRRFYGYGSLVRVIEGTFIDKKVRLEQDVAPLTPGNRKINVSIGGWSGKIELYKLDL